MLNLLNRNGMTVKTQCINFEIAKQLEEFITKKTGRLERHLKADDELEIRLTVIKPQTHTNKEAEVKLGSLFVKKTADSFEEALSTCFDALESGLERRKNN